MAEQKMTVLFIDDDPLVLKAVLRHFNVHPTISALAALNAKAAMRLMAAAPVDAVVSNLRMSSMEGIELLRDMSVRYPRTACILLSGFLDGFWLKRAIQLTQIEAFLGKPFGDDRPDKDLAEAARRRWAHEPREHVELMAISMN